MLNIIMIHSGLPLVPDDLLRLPFSSKEHGTAKSELLLRSKHSGNIHGLGSLSLLTRHALYPWDLLQPHIQCDVIGNHDVSTPHVG